MKNASDYAKKLATLLRKLKQSVSYEELPPRDPISQLVVSFLQWESTRKSAEAAFHRVVAAVVDHNELRVSHAHEVARILGPRYPRAQERSDRLRDALQEIFNREHATSLDALAGRSKKDVRAYLESLPGMTCYVSARMMLLCFGGGAVPVDENLAALFKREAVVDPDAGVEEIAGFLERQVKAEDALETHLTLQAWADASARPGSGENAGKPRKTASAKGDAAARADRKRTKKAKTSR